MDGIAGSQGVGVCFVPVTGEGTMADLKVVGYTGEYSDGAIYCSKLDRSGRTSGEMMYWLDLEEFDDGEVVWPAQYGWWTADGATDLNTVTLQAGEGLWMTLPSADYQFQSSGQVSKETIPVQLIAGSQMCPNPTPVIADMGAAYIDGYEGEYSEGAIYCCKLDRSGRTSGEMMYWLDLEEFDDGEVVWPAQYGWWTADGATELNSTTIKAGESVWLTCPKVGYTLNWASPL